MTEAEREQQVKDEVRARCGWKCSCCGMPQAVQKAKSGRALSVHRYEAGSDYDDAGCVALCQSCHCRAHASFKQRKGFVPVATTIALHPKITPAEYRVVRELAATLGLSDDLAAAMIFRAGLEAKGLRPPAGGKGV